MTTMAPSIKPLRPLSTLRHTLCQHCLRTTRFYSSTLPPPAPPQAGYTPLPRSLLSITGPDTPRFLHGLLTTSISESTPGHFSALLSAPGRVLHDTFLYPITDGFVLESSPAHAKALLSHLKRHKLRSKLALRPADDDYEVLALWRPEERWTAHGAQASPHDGVVELVDARAPGMGRRALVARGADVGRLLEGLEKATPAQYDIRRYVRGVPEGSGEIVHGEALPLNYNLDVMGAVDFRKGCYVGQELTVRTHHTGVVRRRVLPIVLYEGEAPDGVGYDAAWKGEQPGAEAEFKVQGKRGRPGRWIAGVGNVGLAMCRLELMTDLAVTNEPSGFDAADRFVVDVEGGGEVGVKAFVPDWLRGKVRAPKKQQRVE